MKAKNNQYFLKDKKAQIYRRVSGGRDSEGYEIEGAYYPYAKAPLWCYSKQLSAALIYAAQLMTTNETRLFVFNYLKGVKQYDLILYRDSWYEITRVDTTDDYNGELFVYVQDCGRGNTPDEDSIKDYDANKWE